MAERFVRALKTVITPPKPWGAFHASFFAAMLLLAALLFFFSAKLKKRPRLVYGLTIGMGAFLLFIEAFKQFYYAVQIGEDGLYWGEYQWHAFPFQFCSAPLYACIALCFFKKGAIHDGLCCFLATFGAFAGAGVMTTPGAVLIDSLFIDLHTMFWHTAVFLLGVLQWAGGAFERGVRSYLAACAFFVLLVAVALILDFSLPQLAEENFNLFYIGPYLPCTINVLDKVWAAVPYPVFLLIYIFGFTGIAAAIFFAVRTALSLSGRAAKRARGDKRLSQTDSPGCPPSDGRD